MGGVNMRGMTQSREPYHHGDLRNALVESASRLIEASGPGAFSLREAAREVGVSANAAYRHFDDKGALISAVADDGFERLAKRMLRAIDGAPGRRAEEPPAIARFRAVGRAYVEFAIEHPALFRVMFGEHGAGCASAPAKEADEVTPWTLLGTALDALVEAGLLTPERREGAELKAWTVVHGFASLAIDGLLGAPTARARATALEDALDFAVVGLCGEATSGRRKR
jgi:AcrR family transcriptional regulator